MQSSSILSVDLQTIEHNLHHLKTQFGQVMVMVKANAYGTDSHTLSKFIQTNITSGIPFLGVSHVWEGLRLREAGITLPIFVISSPPYQAELTVMHGLSPGVNTIEEAEAINRASQKMGKITPVHLHLDTGMNRFGISSIQAHDLYNYIQNSPYLLLEGIMTHFIAAESPAFDAVTLKQIQTFKEFIDSLPTLPRWIHAANSGGAVRFPMPFCNMVRIGLGILGYGVCVEGSKPALKLTTTLASVNTCSKGATVGYNCAYTFDKDEGRIGVIPVGYHDGLHRSLSNKGYVLIRGNKAPMIGTVCMDFMMVDLTDIPEAQVGDEVCLFGPALSPEMVAGWAQTDVREILVSIPLRVQRHWVNLKPSIQRKEHEPANTERLPDSLLPFEKDPSSR